MPIEQLRNVLVIALCVVVFLMYQAWRQDYGVKLPPPAPSPTAPAAPGSVPMQSEETAVDVPQPPATQGPQPAAVPERVAASSEGLVEVRTDVLSVVIDPKGASLHRIDLLDYPVSTEQPDTPFRLFNDVPPNVFIAQSGLLGADGPPNHHAVFEAEQSQYVLGDDADALEVRLSWRGEGGLTVTKVYTFQRDSYLIGVRFEVANGTGQAWSGRMYGQFQRTEVAPKGGLFRTYTYTGGVVSGPEKPYEKIDFSDMADVDLDRSQQGGWAAMIQHYFAGAWVPEQSTVSHLYTKALGGARYVLGVITPAQTVANGETGVFSLELYAGPKIQKRMEAVAPHLERTVDYGWLWLIAEPLFWLLDKIHGFVGNWGWSIIILTILIKLAFFHLSATSYKSMARMRKLQPRITAIRDRYGADKARMNQAMMELYKTEKINPLGGCLPIVVQIPVFIALYWVLLESVELRQAPFIFWLQDLSVHDPFFVLPIMMGITMLAQQKLNPAPPDPMQAKIMMALPFVFTFLFLFFPAGLVLYWFVNNLLSIAQQWVITRKIVGTT